MYCIKIPKVKMPIKKKLPVFPNIKSTVSHDYERNHRQKSISKEEIAIVEKYCDKSITLENQLTIPNIKCVINPPLSKKNVKVMKDSHSRMQKSAVRARPKERYNTVIINIICRIPI